MEIAGVLTAGKFLSTALEQLGKRCQPQESPASQPLESRAMPGPTTAATTAFRQMAAPYDVTEISPRKFSEMIQKLYDAGLLNDQEFQELSLIRVELDSDRVEPDEAVNLVDFYLDKLRELRETIEEASGSLPASGQSRLVSIARRLQWVEKFAAIQSAGEEAGLDALA
jgi:hypothetical protein